MKTEKEILQEIERIRDFLEREEMGTYDLSIYQERLSMLRWVLK